MKERRQFRVRLAGADQPVELWIRIPLTSSIAQHAEYREVAAFLSFPQELVLINLLDMMDQPIQYHPGQPPRFAATRGAVSDEFFRRTRIDRGVSLSHQHSTAQAMPF